MRVITPYRESIAEVCKTESFFMTDILQEQPWPSELPHLTPRLSLTTRSVLPYEGVSKTHVRQTKISKILAALWQICAYERHKK